MSHMLLFTQATLHGPSAQPVALITLMMQHQGCDWTTDPPIHGWQRKISKISLVPCKTPHYAACSSLWMSLSPHAETQRRDKATLQMQGCLSVMYDLHLPSSPPPLSLPPPHGLLISSSSISHIRQTEEMNAGEFISHAGIVSAWWALN